MRKPILFSISGGLTLWSLGRLISWLEAPVNGRMFYATIDRLLAVAMFAEISLITIQTYRGVRSHFNVASTIDSRIEYAMTGLITVVVLIVIFLTIQCFYSLKLPKDWLLATRSGMIFLLLSCAIGFVISWWGHHQINQGAAPEIVGNAGVAKFPHGVALHAIQLLPLLAWINGRLRFCEKRSMILVSLAIALTTLMLLYSIVQTLAGHSRWDAGWLLNSFN